ncbi:hypothetical protein A9958_13385 (plasmid) [Staphylococcus simulans]|nr:hypothetical protein BI282_13380 [Staphylococcus simulans]AVO06315.1 hypothetical protein BI283_13000 [Staphylococcus simulans]AWG19970.1 hypothetical protein A9958_13385 [Staphylococcus simulans]AWI02854.1 hypothetical protein A7X73_12920 [Staphylococcus simulans]
MINSKLVEINQAKIGIVIMNFFISIIIFFVPFLLMDSDASIKDMFNSIQTLLYFTIYYLLNLILLAFTIFKTNFIIKINLLRKKFVVFQFEIYLFTLIIYFLIIIYENTLTKSMYNTFTFLLIFDTLVLQFLKLLKQYIKQK